MLYYNSKGRLASTRDDNQARRHNLLSLLQASAYPARPEAAARLYERLGPAPIGISQDGARQAIRRVLAELGLSHLPIEDVLSVVDQSWKLAIKVGG